MTITIVDALETIKANISNLEIRATESNIVNINQANGLINALIDLAIRNDNRVPEDKHEVKEEENNAVESES